MKTRHDEARHRRHETNFHRHEFQSEERSRRGCDVRGNKRADSRARRGDGEITVPLIGSEGLVC